VLDIIVGRQVLWTLAIKKSYFVQVKVISCLSFSIFEHLNTTVAMAFAGSDPNAQKFHYGPPLFPIQDFDLPIGDENGSLGASQTRPYRCHMCSQTFTRQEALHYHLIGPKHLNQRPFQCKQCPHAFTRDADLKRHKQTVHDKLKFVCEADGASGSKSGCGRSYTRAATLRKHQQNCNAWLSPKAKPDLPVGSLESSLGSIFHLQNVGKGHPSQQTPQSSEPVVSQAPPQSPSRARFNYCSVCDCRRSSIQKSSFLYHLLNHLEDINGLAYRCPDCTASFGLQEHLVVHRDRCQWLEPVPVPDSEEPQPKRLESKNICPKIRITIDCKETVWGCDIRTNQFYTHGGIMNHVSASDSSTCSRNRQRIFLLLNTKLLEQLEQHIPTLRTLQKGVVSPSTLSYIRHKVDEAEAGQNRQVASNGFLNNFATDQLMPLSTIW
jgi:hypothetical protein